MKTSAKSSLIVGIAMASFITIGCKKGGPPPAAEAAALPIAAQAPATETASAGVLATAKLPRLIDLGADKCIPCKLMAPILEELKKEHEGRLIVDFIDVWKNPDAGTPYGVETIPTQIFFDASGKELFRHTGFFAKDGILAKWKELGVDLSDGKAGTGIVRETPVAADSRPREQVCSMCDGDIQPKTKAIVKGQSEQRLLCSPHCYFIYLSSLVGADPKLEEAKVNVTDWASGDSVPATTASFLYGMDPGGRPVIKAFGDPAAAAKEQAANPGTLVTWDVLRSKELATRCAFCDRAVYPEDACAVKFGSTHGYGCCTHCSLGVAARLKQDIEVEAKDGLTGNPIRIKTFDGQLASLEPATAIAWFGQKMGPDGKWVSAGCFKQGFFVDAENLQKWLDARPAMTGRQITIVQALSDKMKLSPEQIAKACKLGECK